MKNKLYWALTQQIEAILEEAEVENGFTIILQLQLLQEIRDNLFWKVIDEVVEYDETDWALKEAEYE